MAKGTVGRYHIRQELNRGGMGRVYRAYDPDFDRDVAIKVMPAAIASEEVFRKRFEREAEIIRMLQHPGIVPIYDFGQDEGRLYLAMRFMTGGSLKDLLKDGPLSLKRAAKIVYDLCQALDNAHRHKIIHRDMKPGNVLFDHDENAYLADFGIARLTSEPTRLTRTNAIMGTPAYMSPEQVRADIEVDPRSDIYSLGIIFFEMLTGRVPYRSDTPSKTMLMHLTHPVPSILKIYPELPYNCELVLQTALAKSRTDRYSSAVEFAHEVHKLVLGQPGRIPAAPAPAVVKAKKPEPPKQPNALSQKTADGETIDEIYIEQHHLTSGNDLIDDILTYYNDPQKLRDERIERIREVRRQEEERREQRQQERATQLKRLRRRRQFFRWLWIIFFAFLMAMITYYIYTYLFPS